MLDDRIKNSSIISSNYVFTGADSIIEHGKKPNDSQVKTQFFDEFIEPFSFAYKTAQEIGGRRIIGERSIRHYWDVAVHLQNLGFDKRTIIQGILHDTGEDGIHSIIEMHERLEDIKDKFGDEIAVGVGALTNKYALLIEMFSERSMADLPLTRNSLDIIIARTAKGIKGLKLGESGEKYIKNIKRSRYWAKLGMWATVQLTDPNATILQALQLASYFPYIREIYHSCIDLFHGDDTIPYGPFAVKLVDGIDNNRNLTRDTLKLRKLTKKTQVVIDHAIFLEKYLIENRYQKDLSLFSNLIDESIRQALIQYNREAIALSGDYIDTRWRPMRNYLSSVVGTFKKRYEQRKLITV